MKGPIKFVLQVILIVTGLLSFSIFNFAQSVTEWQQDIDLLVSKIEQYHPMPWTRISQEQFKAKAGEIKSNLSFWDNEKIVLEILKLTASIRDGHTEVLLDNQENFNLWFPIRIEKFQDGLFITGTDKNNIELLGNKIVRIGNLDSDTAYKLISEIIASDSDFGVARRVSNFISNAIILEKLGIISSKDLLSLEVFGSDNLVKKVDLASSVWELSFSWAYDKKSVPAYGELVSIFDINSGSLPLYLSGFMKTPDPFWFEYIPEDKMLYFQLNQVFDGNNETLLDFTRRLFETYDSKEAEIDKFLIDLRFNEGGNTDLLSEVVEEFRKRREFFENDGLFVITGTNTFSAASAFIGKMKIATDAITVGDITAGPLNFSSDPVMFFLPHSNLLVNISRLYIQNGQASDRRGYYPPDYYIPLRSEDYLSFSDPVMDAVKAYHVKSLKKILYNEGVDSFRLKIQEMKSLNGSTETWFPYTSYELALFTFNDLIPSGKYEEAIEVSKLNTITYPESIWGWFILGMIYENIGELNSALDCFERLLAIEPYNVEIKWERDKVKSVLKPMTLDQSILKSYTGEFGEYKIIIDDGLLKYRDKDGQNRNLTPINETYFLIEDSSYRIVFVLKNNRAETIKLIKWDGKTRVYHRSGFKN